MRGWFRESYRHYLASKGIETSKFGKKYKIKLVAPGVLKDYAAMNPDAARALGFRGIKRNEILVDRTQTPIQQEADVKHEIAEKKLMDGGMKYWPAHEKALLAEKMSFDVFRRRYLAGKDDEVTKAVKHYRERGIPEDAIDEQIKREFGLSDEEVDKAKIRSYMALKDVVPDEFWLDPDAEAPPGVPMSFWVSPDEHTPGFWARKSRARDVLVWDPMRPVDTSIIPEGSWLAERKWDGTRIRLAVQDNKVSLLNRRGNDKSRQFPELQHVAGDLRGDVVLDGELIVPERVSDRRGHWEGGKESFTLLAKREHLKSDDDIDEAAQRTPAKFMAFDILAAHGKSLKSHPLNERRRFLKDAVRTEWGVQVVDASPRVKQVMASARKQGAEGILLKDPDSAYHGGRSKSWRKLKFKKMRDAVVSGYEPGMGKRSGMIGALRIADARGRSLGKVGTGFTDEENGRLKRLLDAGKRPVVRVEYRTVGSRGALKEPVYMGLRSDIERGEVN